MTMYAIISLGGKQYRVEQGQRLLVDRLPYDESATFHPRVLFLGGDGKAELAPKGGDVTARVVGNVLGDKVRIGKYRKRTGYRRHTGHRARLSQIEITAVGAKSPPRSRAAKAAETTEPAAKPATTRRRAAKPKAEAKEAEAE